MGSDAARIVMVVFRRDENSDGGVDELRDRKHLETTRRSIILIYKTPCSQSPSNFLYIKF